MEACPSKCPSWLRPSPERLPSMPESTSAPTIERPKTIDDYKSSAKPTWCPGCGDFGVLNAVYNSLRVKGYNTEDVVVVSGIGCSSRFPFFVNAYGFHGV